MCVDVKLL